MPTPRTATLRSAPPPAGPPVVALYELVCPDDGRLESGLDFAACMARARQHNQANPDHVADCFQQDLE